MKKALTLLLSICLFGSLFLVNASAIASDDLTITASSGYYAQEKSASEKEGVIAISAHFAKFDEINVKKAGIMIYVAGNENNEAKIARVESTKVDSAAFSAIFNGIAMINFDKEVIAKAYVVVGDEYIYSEAITTSVDSTRWVGIKPEDKTLSYTLLDDGTYGVVAGEEAATQESIKIPETYKGIKVTQIMENGFRGVTTLKEVTIPDSITRINQYAFYGCSSLKTVVIPEGVNFIGKYAFYDAALTSVTFEDYKGWLLENDVRTLPAVNGLEKINLGGNTYTGPHNGSETKSIAISINQKDDAANALKGTIKLTVYSNKFDNSTTSANLYTENWIKQ